MAEADIFLHGAQRLVCADHVGARLYHRRAAFGGMHQRFMADMDTNIGLGGASIPAGGLLKQERAGRDAGTPRTAPFTDSARSCVTNFPGGGRT